VIQVTLARLFAGKIKQFVGRPNRTCARGEIEFDLVFIGVKPGVKQERFQSHGGDLATDRRAGEKFGGLP
jgi:hypothetical protein